MNPSRHRSMENSTSTPTCFGRSRACVLHGVVLAISTSIFIISMILTAYLTEKATIVVILIVAASLLYVLGFTSSFYTINYYKLNCMAPKNNNSDQINRIIASLENSSRNRPSQDIVSFSRSREQVRITPLPPYEVQMSEMSRMLLPGASRSTNLSQREADIYEEARKLLRRVYEEINIPHPHAEQSTRNEQSAQQMSHSTRNEQSVQQMSHSTRNEHSIESVVHLPRNEHAMQKLVQSPRNERSMQPLAESPRNEQLPKKVVQSPRIERSFKQAVKLPEIPTAHKSILPKLSHPNLADNLEEASANSMLVHGFEPEDFRANEATQREGASNSLPTQLDLKRLIVGNERCTAGPLQSSAGKISSNEASVKSILSRGFSSEEIFTNQASQKKGDSSSLPSQHDLQRLKVSNEGCTVGPLHPSAEREDLLKSARKRKLASPAEQWKTGPQTKTRITSKVIADNDTQNIVYEQIEAVRNSSSKNSSLVYEPVEYFCLENDSEDTSERVSSVRSAVSEPGRKRNVSNPTGKVCRQLSALSTSKFCQLGKSPEDLLDAIATCFDLTPDEWMVAWKLGQKDVLPSERAKILGLRLHENSHDDDKNQRQLRKIK